MPRPTVHDDLTIAQMAERGVGAVARCNKCGRQKPIDLTALIAKVGPDYRLYNKRTRCRRKDCNGWVRFFWVGGWGMGMVDRAG